MCHGVECDQGRPGDLALGRECLACSEGGLLLPNYCRSDAISARRADMLDRGSTVSEVLT